MTFKAQRLAFAKIVSNQYSKEEKQSLYNVLVAHHFGYNRFEAHQKDSDTFPAEKEIVFSEAIQRLEQHEPIQYIIGETVFFSIPFLVNKHTLIPRPETEELVAWILEDAKNKDRILKVIDVGTGSGCIAISLAKELIDAEVSAIDISEGALEVAKRNANTNTVHVNFAVQDILKVEKLSENYDVIVSNPPYVRELEKKMMQENVLAFEPETALFVDDKDPLVFYRKIAELALSHLKDEGYLYFEINEYLGLEMTELLRQIGFTNCLIKKDSYGKERMIRATL